VSATELALLAAAVVVGALLGVAGAVLGMSEAFEKRLEWL
jgi:hypothetical protein